MNNKKIILDFSTCNILANAVKFTELISSYHEENYDIYIIKKNWKKDCEFQGLKFDKDEKTFIRSDGIYLWDPSIHPYDYFENLVFSSFDNLKFIDEISFFKKIIYTFKKNYISYTSCLSIMAPSEERPMLRKEFFNYLKENLSIRELAKSTLRILEFEIAPYFKLKPKNFYPLRYKLSPKMYTKDVEEIIKKFTNGRKKILLSVSWDESKRFEVLDDRLKGGPAFKNGLNDDFNKLKKTVETIDKKILNGENFQFLLASKKAVDWEKFLKSDFLDLRCFEELNLSLSQSIYICQELSSFTINWPSTFGQWITVCSGIEHITYYDFKDTAVWSRKNINNSELKFFEK